MITETLEIITVYTGEELDENHILYGLVRKFYISVDWRVITTSGIDNEFMVNTELHGVC